MVIRSAAVFLLVEDDPDEVFLINRALAGLSVKPDFRHVKDGEEAIRYLAGDGRYSDREKHPIPDLVLLDIKTPKRDGFEVLKWIRTRMPPGLPVLMLSSTDQPESVRRAYAMGASSFLMKPSFTAFETMVHCIHEYWVRWNEAPGRNNGDAMFV